MYGREDRGYGARDSFRVEWERPREISSFQIPWMEEYARVQLKRWWTKIRRFVHLIHLIL